jgi:hypothetical protein
MSAVSGPSQSCAKPKLIILESSRGHELAIYAFDLLHLTQFRCRKAGGLLQYQPRKEDGELGER